MHSPTCDSSFGNCMDNFFIIAIDFCMLLSSSTAYPTTVYPEEVLSQDSLISLIKDMHSTTSSGGIVSQTEALTLGMCCKIELVNNFIRLEVFDELLYVSF